MDRDHWAAAEVNAAWNNHDGGQISQAETAKQMQLLSAEPGPVPGGGRFLHRVLPDPTKGDVILYSE